MGTSLQHRTQFESNINFSESIKGLKPMPNDWLITVYFYSALHLIEEELINRGFASRDHQSRNRNVRTYLRAVARPYAALYTESRVARYECTLITQDKVDNAKRNLDRICDVLNPRSQNQTDSTARTGQDTESTSATTTGNTSTKNNT